MAGLQGAMAAGTLTAAEITAFYAERIARLNPALHAVITVYPGADADQLALLTGVPGGAWVFTFAVVAIGALIAGAFLLLPGLSHWFLTHT